MCRVGWPSMAKCFSPIKKHSWIQTIGSLFSPLNVTLESSFYWSIFSHSGVHTDSGNVKKTAVPRCERLWASYVKKCYVCKARYVEKIRRSSRDFAMKKFVLFNDWERNSETFVQFVSPSSPSSYVSAPTVFGQYLMVVVVGCMTWKPKFLCLALALFCWWPVQPSGPLADQQK